MISDTSLLEVFGGLVKWFLILSAGAVALASLPKLYTWIKDQILDWWYEIGRPPKPQIEQETEAPQEPDPPPVEEEEPW